MAEPQPSNVREGDTIIDDEPAPGAPSGAAGGEERKAAAALSSLDARGDDDEKLTAKRSEADQKALGEAMSRLELLESSNKQQQAASAVAGSGGSATGTGAAVAAKKADEAPKKKVKVDAADVSLLIEELELSKGKATELLKAHDGNAVQAIRAFIGATA